MGEHAPETWTRAIRLSAEDEGDRRSNQRALIICTNDTNTGRTPTICTTAAARETML